MASQSLYSRTSHRSYYKQKAQVQGMHLMELNLPKVKAILARRGRVPAELRGVLTSLATFFSVVKFFYWSRNSDGTLLLIGENKKPGFNQQANVRVTLSNSRDIHLVETLFGFNSHGDVSHGTIKNEDVLMTVVGYAIDDREYKGKMYSIMPVITRISQVAEYSTEGKQIL